MAIDAGFKLNFGLIVACSGYPHPNWAPGEKFSPLIISHGLFDDVVPIDASRTIFEKVKVEIASNEITKKENFKTSKSSIFFPTQIKIILLNKVADA